MVILALDKHIKIISQLAATSLNRLLQVNFPNDPIEGAQLLDHSRRTVLSYSKCYHKCRRAKIS